MRDLIVERGAVVTRDKELKRCITSDINFRKDRSLDITFQDTPLPMSTKSRFLEFVHADHYVRNAPYGTKNQWSMDNKDMADHMLIHDLLEWAKQAKPSQVLLVTGDGGFTSAVERLHELGHTVVLVSRSLQHPSDRLFGAADMCFSLPPKIKTSFKLHFPNHVA